MSPCQSLAHPIATSALDMLARATRATWRRCALLFSSTSKSVPITAPASAGDRFTTRVSGINALTARGGWTPYPASFPTSISIPSLLERFAHLKPGEAATGETVSISGRIHARRDASSKLIFFDLQCGIRAQNTTSAPTADHSQSRVQIMLTAKQYAAANLDMVKETIRRGDVVGVKGHVCRTKTGELSVVPKEMTLLAPCLHQIPDELANIETRTRQRYLDLLVNRSAAQTFVLRRQMIRFMREYFDQRGFLEVETPILWSSVGGASARPFLTKANALGNAPLSLRIAPELFLKQLVIGGFERVYEMSRVFRNEGIDATHNPEFSTCELYWAYADCASLIPFTEELLRRMVTELLGKSTLQLPWATETTNIDFAPAFQRIDIVPALCAALGVQSLPLDGLNRNDKQAIDELIELAKRAGVPASEMPAPPLTSARVLDKLIGHFIEPRCIQPTFLTGHPECMSPLAKSSTSAPGTCERFELFIGGKEFCNAYSELNDAAEQRRRFSQQAAEAAAGDIEAPAVPDEQFCKALEYGLPPTAGWGMGMDRLCMLLAGHAHIRDVLLFPLVKPDASSTE